MRSDNSLVERIRTLANSQNLSLPALETALGLGNGTISRWKSSCPNTDKLLKVADFFHVSTDYLLGREQKITLTEIGKRAESDIDLSQAERDLILKFRRLDDRGRSAVLTVLNHEYTSLTGEETTSVPRQA